MDNQTPETAEKENTSKQEKTIEQGSGTEYYQLNIEDAKKRQAESRQGSYDVDPNLDRKKIKQAVILGFIPFTGAFGVHDSKVGRKKQANIHIGLAVPVFFTEFLMFLGFACDSGCNGFKGVIISLIIFLPAILCFISYVWAIYESSMICYLILSKKSVDIERARLKSFLWVSSIFLAVAVPFFYLILSTYHVIV